MTLDELDVMIAATPDAAAIFVTEPQWRALFHQPGPIDHMGVVEDGRVIYRGLPVWIRSPGEVEVVDRAHAERLGVLRIG